MIASLLLLIYIIIISWLLGVSLQIFLPGIKNEGSGHPVVSILFGLTGLAFYLQLFHFFYPISIGAHISVITIVILLYLLKSKGIRQVFEDHLRIISKEKNFIWFIPILILATLINCIGRAGVGDIADYHLQAIKWDATFPVVKGLGNLRRQLANNSLWFLLHSYAGFDFLKLNSVYVLNALLLILGGIYFYPTEDKKYPLIHTVILLYIVLMSFRKYVGAVTNDYAITIFTLILLTEWICSEYSENRKLISVLIIIILPAFKLSSIAMMIIPAYFIYVLFRKKEFNGIIVTVIFGLIVYSPWLLTTWYKSGYLVYPVKATAFGSPDWQMNSATLDYERIINIANERVPGMPTLEVMKLSFTQWFPAWIKSLDVFSKMLLLLFGILPIIGLLKTESRKHFQKVIKDNQFIPILLLMCIAFPLWFLNAPATRFVFGYLVFGIAVMIHLLMKNRVENLTTKYVLYLSTFVILINALLFTIQYSGPHFFADSLLTPRKYGTNTMHKIELSQGYVFSPDSNEQCWDVDIPCTSIVDSSLHWRTNNLSDGFSVKKTME